MAAEKAGNDKRFTLDIVGRDEDVPRIIRAYGRACGGEFALVLRPGNARGVLVHIPKGGASATFWQGEGTDAPEAPISPVSPADAVVMVRTEQKAVPKAGPAVLRGGWRGHMLCDENTPRVFLERRIATYGTLRLESRAGEGWRWTVTRAERWFSEPGEVSGKGIPTLGEAIARGIAAAMRVVGDACSVRDTRRRASMDEGYAAAHPPRPARERKNPTDRLKEPKGKGKGKGASPPTVRADAETASAFGLTGIPGVTVVPALDAGPVPAPPDGPKELRRIAEITRKDAQALAELTEWERGWKTSADAAGHLQRARGLVRHAQGLVRSPLCRGDEREEAVRAIRSATTAYEAARKAVSEGRTWDAARQVRYVSEKVALAAARAAKACAAGQTSLGLTRQRAEVPSSPRAGKPGKVRDRDLPRRPRAPSRVPSPSPASAEADPEKDKVLLDAFAAAVQAAMRSAA
ncbi:hypothetical protein L6R50_08860 [Myxococcota bacterium]|nr:hypothetical protein [Myxococcota bacterium]